MLRNALRKELAALLTAPAGSRQPVIRRSLQDAWIYATDLPALYDGPIPDTLLESLADAGWEYTQEQGWIQLRKAAPEPPEDWFSGSFGPEAACCMSLLERHPALTCEGTEAAQRKLIKAGEEGEKAYETACAALHRQWAERLRKGERIPKLSRYYFKG